MRWRRRWIASWARPCARSSNRVLFGLAWHATVPPQTVLVPNLPTVAQGVPPKALMHLFSAMVAHPDKPENRMIPSFLVNHRCIVQFYPVPPQLKCMCFTAPGAHPPHPPHTPTCSTNGIVYHRHIVHANGRFF